MFPRIKNARHINDYVIELEFADGRHAQMDFRNKVVGRGGVFAPLEDIDFFKQVKVDQESGTIFWPNDVDLDPDVLYSEAMGVPLPKVEAA